MQINDSLITKLRSFRRGLIECNCMNVTMSIYPIPSTHNCQKSSYIDKGYYRRHNGEIHLCKKGQESSADFRILECDLCHQKITLLNTGMQNWDKISGILDENKCKPSIYIKEEN